MGAPYNFSMLNFFCNLVSNMVILLCFLPRKAEAELAMRQFTVEGSWHCSPPRSMECACQSASCNPDLGRAQRSPDEATEADTRPGLQAERSCGLMGTCERSGTQTHKEPQLFVLLSLPLCFSSAQQSTVQLQEGHLRVEQKHDCG